MINRKSTFFLGVFIFIIPFLGIPSFWKTVFIVLSGLFLIILSIRIVLPKKEIKSRLRKEKFTPVFVESMPANPKKDTPNDIVAPAPIIKTEEDENTVNQE